MQVRAMLLRGRLRGTILPARKGPQYLREGGRPTISKFLFKSINYPFKISWNRVSKASPSTRRPWRTLESVSNIMVPYFSYVSLVLCAGFHFSIATDKYFLQSTILGCVNVTGLHPIMTWSCTAISSPESAMTMFFPLTYIMTWDYLRCLSVLSKEYCPKSTVQIDWQTPYLTLWLERLKKNIFRSTWCVKTWK